MNRAFPEKLGNMLDEVMPKAGPGRTDQDQRCRTCLR